MKKNELTPIETAALKQIRNHLIHHGRTPSIRELMATLHYKSPRSVQDVIERLIQKGLLQKTTIGSIKSIKAPILSSFHANTVDVPLVGTVSCGAPICAEENIETMISVSVALAKGNHKYFILHAKGDSMNMAGINDGDLVLVRQQHAANNGDKVVALIDNEATIKEFYRRPDLIILRPKSSNKSHQPIILTEDFQVQGVIIGVIPTI